MQHEYSEAVVLGLGAAGAAITEELARLGVPVTALDRMDGVASSLTNQKWKHSGLLYERGEQAVKIWHAYTQSHPLEQRHLLKTGAHFLCRKEETLCEREARWRDWPIPYARLGQEFPVPSSALGKPICTGGFAAFDGILDFPALIADLCAHAARRGARIVGGATVKRLLRDADAVTGVVYEKDGMQTRLDCRYCVVALGAWAPEALRTVGVSLPVSNWKSHVLTVEGELVERITAWLDEPKVTLVPYQGHTLIADTRRTPAAHGFDRAPIAGAADAILDDLALAFPSLRPSALKPMRVHACIKTEFNGAGARNQEAAVFAEAHHGVRGLSVVFPGKASLMFALAREVAADVQRTRPAAIKPGFNRISAWPVKSPVRGKRGATTRVERFRRFRMKRRYWSPRKRKLYGVVTLPYNVPLRRGAFLVCRSFQRGRRWSEGCCGLCPSGTRGSRSSGSTGGSVVTECHLIERVRGYGSAITARRTASARLFCDWVMTSPRRPPMAPSGVPWRSWT